MTQLIFENPNGLTSDSQSGSRKPCSNASDLYALPLKTSFAYLPSAVSNTPARHFALVTGQTCVRTAREYPNNCLMRGLRADRYRNNRWNNRWNTRPLTWPCPPASLAGANRQSLAPGYASLPRVGCQKVKMEGMAARSAHDRTIRLLLPLHPCAVRRSCGCPVAVAVNFFLFFFRTSAAASGRAFGVHFVTVAQWVLHKHRDGRYLCLSPPHSASLVRVSQAQARRTVIPGGTGGSQPREEIEAGRRGVLVSYHWRSGAVKSLMRTVQRPGGKCACGSCVVRRHGACRVATPAGRRLRVSRKSTGPRDAVTAGFAWACCVPR